MWFKNMEGSELATTLFLGECPKAKRQQCFAKEGLEMLGQCEVKSWCPCSLTPGWVWYSHWLLWVTFTALSQEPARWSPKMSCCESKIRHHFHVLGFICCSGFTVISGNCFLQPQNQVYPILKHSNNKIWMSLGAAPTHLVLKQLSV